MTFSKRFASISLALQLFSMLAVAHTQPKTHAVSKSHELHFDASDRLRGEAWDWFTPSSGNHSYAFAHSLLLLGMNMEGEHFIWRIEGAQDALLGLPHNAIASGMQGQLGLGAAYSVANQGKTNTASAFLKQAYAGYRFSGSLYLQAGRFGFNDGSEVQPVNKKLALILNTRVAQRLVGEFGFSAVGRSFDGALLTAHAADGQFTLLASRPTEGVFQVAGMKELQINLIYGSYIHQQHLAGGDGELRLFAIDYDDHRPGVLKTDNRPLGVRKLDFAPVKIGTWGGNDAVVIPTGHSGHLDLIVWGALQNGHWGVQRQRAGAFFAEGGWQADRAFLQPWLSAGYSYGSGDANPNDRVHGTFMQMLPTPRLAARFPFYDMENNEDVYGSLVLHPVSAVAVRSEAHALRLTNGNDLWYMGGGAFQSGTFGYVGRSAAGARSLANVADLSVDFPVVRQVTMTAYIGHAWGKAVLAAIYPSGKDGSFAYLETNWRF